LPSSFKSFMRSKCNIFVVVLCSLYPVFYLVNCSVTGIMLMQNTSGDNESP
jgi:hypothetical protein